MPFVALLSSMMNFLDLIKEKLIQTITTNRMGRKYKKYLEYDKLYACEECGTHLSAHELIVSKAFYGRGFFG